MKIEGFIASLALLSSSALALEEHVTDSVIAKQRATLAEYIKDKGYGPQSPRDIDDLNGENNLKFGIAPAYTHMNLCNIHFHKNAEHKGGEFTTYAGNGDGKGYYTGYVYNGSLTQDELSPFESEGSELQSGDTIEVHYVHSTANVKPAPTLGACLSESLANPQLRVETQVFVLVNDANALDFVRLTEYAQKDGYYQAINILNNTGTPVEYAGSTTGSSYNEIASPLQVTWSVRPRVAKLNIASVDKWLQSNDFDEDHAHSVRNLITNPELLSSGH
ncbi:delta-class carbonic anhydrase [Vibrio sp. S4M6]|uniref:delta-class carbonic anhydrase n=1 Tax=Vibrio sinus TaxID=2946865 RepID=UPI00202A76D8|nr:delta-class carbonic anhydrase [Vibrio sinus]MCL9781191.1 delta-class carbonic anhydrase [Vibrio sinus]